jgi:uncharacterized protein YebE (UPF0316 family)
MVSCEFLNSDMFRLLVLPLLIFCARICDVSLGTMRIIFVSRGMKYLAPVLGFFEVLIWLLAIGQIMKNLTNVTNYIAYASGFAAGNFVGIYLENKLSMGIQIIRVITRMDAGGLVEFLRHEGFTVTSIDAQGGTGPVKVLFTIVKRREMNKIIDIVKKFNPKAFYTVEDVKLVSEHSYLTGKNGVTKDRLDVFRKLREDK